MAVDVVVAVLTTVFSVLVKVVGLPDQIASNYTRKSTEGLSGWFVLSAFFSYLLWTVHGFLQHDWSLIIGQGLGVITTAILVGQLFLYRGNHRSTKLSGSTWLILPGIVARRSRRIVRRSNSPPGASFGCSFITIRAVHCKGMWA